MKTSNPLSSTIYGKNNSSISGYSPSSYNSYEQYGMPPAKTLTKSSIVNATLFTMMVVIFFAVVTVYAGFVNPGLASLMSGAGCFGIIIMGFVIAFTSAKRGSFIATMLFAAAEGLMVGGFSFFIGNRPIDGEPGWVIVSQAIIATIGLFFASLALYGFGIVKVTKKFTSFLVMAMAGFAMLYLINFIITLIFGNNLLLSSGPLPIIIAAAAIVLGCMSLIQDFHSFDVVTQNASGVEPRFKWAMAVAFMTSLVWLYTEVLRLLYLLKRD